MLHFLQYNYLGLPGQNWYMAAVWGNFFIIFVMAPLGWIWSKCKFWPLRPIKHSLEHLHEKHDASHQKLDRLIQRLEDLHGRVDELHQKHDELKSSLEDR